MRHEDAHLDIVGAALLVSGAVALIFRDRWPVPVLAAVTAVTGAYYALGSVAGPAAFAFVVALFSAVRRGNRVAGWAAVLVAIAGSTSHSVIHEDGENWFGRIVGLSVWLTLVVVVGEVARARKIAMLEARRVYEEEQRRKTSEERLSIARELHDVLAHNIALINVQAGVALHLIDDNPEQVRTALATIKQASKDTLRDMRSVLGVLRQVDEDAERAPAPSIARLQALVEHSAKTGLSVTVTTSGTTVDLQTSVDQSAYRIIQEALTNVAKHSQATQASVSLTYGDEELTVRIDDDGPARPDDDITGTGNGIPGMRERAVAVGGELTAVAKPGGGFRVTAKLPLSKEQTA